MSDVALRKTGRGVPLRNGRESAMANVPRSAAPSSAVSGGRQGVLSFSAERRAGGDKDA